MAPLFSLYQQFLPAPYSSLILQENPEHDLLDMNPALVLAMAYLFGRCLLEVKILIRNEQGEPLAATCNKCGKFTLDTRDFLCASCTFDHFMRSFFAPTVSHNVHDEKEDDHVSKS